MFKKMLIITALLVVCGCSTKEGMLSSSVEQKQNIPSQSVFNAPNIGPLMKDFVNFNFNNAEQAISEIDALLVKAEAEQGDIAPLLVLKGLAQSQNNKSDVAFDYMTEAIQLRPEAELYALRALVLWRGGKMRGALRDAEYALLKEDDIALGVMVQGLVWLQEDNISKACEALANACEAGQCYGLEHARAQGQCTP